MISIANLKKIKCIKNGKRPAEEWKHLKKFPTQIENSIKNFNIGLLTGKINNIIVLDVDEKDNGIEEFKLYIAEYGEPLTVKQKHQIADIITSLNILILIPTCNF